MIPFSRLWKGSSAAAETTAATPSRATSSPTKQVSGILGAGSVVGRCLLLRQLGEGACGRVFHAHHKTLNISVAIKLLQPGLLNDPRVHEQLKHEAQLLARLNHPHVVRIWDFDDDPACPYIVMEYVEGLSLADLIEQSGRLAPHRVVDMMRQVARGLNAAWKIGIIHRDLKPANVLMTREGDAKLSDLGLAVVMGNASGTAWPVAAGTPLYAAPEQCFAPEKVDQRSDLYALGATFYHALTGSPPFTGESIGEVMNAHAYESAVPPHQVVPGIPDGLSAIFLRLLAKDPDHRYADYEELLAILDGQAQGTSGARQRARATNIVPRANLEAVLRTQPYLSDEPEAPSQEKANDGPRPQPGKKTMVTRLPFIPADPAAPPRGPSRISGDRSTSQLDKTTFLTGETPPAKSPPAAEAIPADGPLAQAIAASKAGRGAEAVPLLRKVLAREPDNETALLWLARSVGPGAEAVSLYQRLLEKSPDDVTARQGLLGARLAAASVDARAGNRAAARAVLQQLTKENPELEEAWVGLARLAETPAEADEMWRTVLRMNPGRVEARMALSRRGRR
jgi:serine/threonine protein kinase/Tfp pilus assembly protein PilF